MAERAVVNGVELHWWLTGESGPPLVLVHGSWGDHHGWDRVVPILSRSFRVLTYDRRGHSRSARPAGQGSVHEDVADLAALMAHVGLRDAHILGSSFGAVIVLHLAVARPDLFRSLLVHEPPLLGLLDGPEGRAGLRSARERIAAVLALLEAGQMEAGARLFMETVAFGPGAWAQFPPELRETFVHNAPTFVDEERDPDSRTIDAGALARFSRPVLLSEGEASESFFRLIVDTLARALPKAERRRLGGAGHVPQVTHPEEYVETIVSFLRQVDGTSRAHQEETTMIMRITWGKLRPGSWNEFEKTYNATVAAKGRQVDGLRGRWLLQDTNDRDTGFAVSLWESADDMQQYEQSALYRQEFAPALQPFFVGDYKTYRCEVKYRQ